MSDESWDCVVVGAGAAGLSAALVLGRARQRTLVVDAGRQSNLPAHGIGGLLGQNGRPPAEFYAAGRAEVLAHPTTRIRDGEVVAGEVAAGAVVGEGEGGFRLDLADGTRLVARRVLLAGGMDYRFPDLPGVARRWGRSVFHCPFCHGWEVRDRPLGVLGQGQDAVRRALLLRQWSDDVTLLGNGPVELAGADADRLRAAGVTVDERPVAQLRGPGGDLTDVSFVDGGERPLGGLLVPVTLHQRSRLAAWLGVAIGDPGHVVADPVAVDPMLQTSVPGVFAAGDICTQMPSVAGAVATGSAAAAAIVHSLLPPA